MLHIRKSLVLIFLATCSLLSGQVNRDSLDRVYGLDPTLYNGVLYTYFPPLGSEGDQYIDGKVFTPGSVTIKGKKYENLLLNYDILNQQILLRFIHHNGTTSIICLSRSNLENVHFNNRDFELVKPADKDENIYQVIGKGPARILVSWWKVINPNSAYGQSNMAFSKIHRATCVLRNNQLFRFKNNRSFALCFQKEKQPLIKRYLRQNDVNIKNLSDAGLLELINYCNSI